MVKNEGQLTLQEIEQFGADEILEDIIFVRLLFYREKMGNIDFSNLYQSLYYRAKQLKKGTAFRDKFKVFQTEADLIVREKKEREQKEQLALARASMPTWLDEKNRIDEVDFIDTFAGLYEEEPKYYCVNGNMYDYGGAVDEEKIKKLILHELSPYIKTNLAETVSRLLRILKTKCTIDPPPLDDTKIHTTNGYYSLTDNRFHNIFTFTFNRLNVWYENNDKQPETWLKYLRELLEEDDIKTLQEYLGYCLIPSKKAQKALYVYGKGGEGKSIITSVVKSIFDNSASIINIKNVAEGNFTVATLEKKLVAIDDDAPTAGLKETGQFKSLVTETSPIQVNPKGKKAYETVIYSRFIVLSNAPLQTIYDHSDGVYRRQIIIKTKAKPEGRIDDRFLADKIQKEKDSIFMWCLDGLKRLIEQKYNFTVSKKAQENLEQLKEDSFNVISYAKDTDYIEFGDMAQDATSNEIYDGYTMWCSDNGLTPLSQRSVLNYFKVSQSTHNIKYDNHIMRGQKGIRGFKGVLVKLKWKK